MAEDTGIFFISWWIGRDLTKVQIVMCIGWLKNHDTVFGVQMFFYRIQSFFGQTFFYADTGHDTEALWFDEDLSFFAFMGSYFLTFCIVSTQEPFTVPSGSQYGIVHFRNCFFCFFCQFFMTGEAADVSKLFSVFYKHTCDKYRFCYRSLRRTGSLEGFAWFFGETVQVQAVIPVGTADQRQIMRAEVCAGISKGTTQVLVKGICFFFLIIKIDHFIQNREVAGLFQISGYSGD